MIDLLGRSYTGYQSSIYAFFLSIAKYLHLSIHIVPVSKLLRWVTG